jgi:hypothetical protein
MAVTPHAQSTAPTFSLATLRDILAEMVAAEPERGMRWHHAAMIVALRRIEPGINVGHWVESECVPGRYYFVSRLLNGVEYCMCPDFRQRGGPCKHALAVRLFQACETRDAELPAGAVPFPRRAFSDDDRFELTPAGEAYLDSLDHQPVA